MIKKGIIFILNFALIICIVVLSSIFIFSNTILSKQYMLSVLEKNNYYERVYYEIQDGFKNHIMQSGLDESILKDLYDKKKVKQDIGIALDEIYSNEKINIDTQTIRKTLDNRINKVLKGKNKTPNSEEKEAINTFEDAIIETYSNGIVYSQKYVEQIGETLAKVRAVVFPVKCGVTFITIVLLIIIMAINNNVKESAKSIGIALLSTGILGILLKLLLGTRLHKILILNQIFSDTLVYILKSIVETFFITGIVMAVIGILAIILECANIIGNNKKGIEPE